MRLLRCTLPFVAVLACACSGSDEPSGGSTPNAPTPMPPLPSTCDIPPEPAPLDHDAVVGDGTPASCSNEALQAAVTEGGNVTFDCGAGDVTIAIQEEILVTANTILDGGGRVTLDGQNSSRLLYTETDVALTVKGLTFVRGRSRKTGDNPDSGGAIQSGWRGELQVFDCTFADNEAGHAGEEGGGALYTKSRGRMVVVRSTFLRNRGGTGGAINNLLSELTVVDSTFLDNDATETTNEGGGGGAIYTDGASGETDDAIGGTITLCGSRFEGNRGVTQGGAAYLFAYAPDRVVVNQCAFTDNQVIRKSSDGGALGGALRVGNAPLQVANSAFLRNSADVHGGGIWVDGRHSTEVVNCTFQGNHAGVPGQEGGYGGAISGGNLLMRYLTIVDNVAEHSGGAVFGEENLTLEYSILVNNTANNEWDIDESCRNTMSGGNNIQWPDPSASGKDTLCTNEVMAVDPLLGELADQGGPTLTFPLLSGSPAIGVGTDCPATDQRGEPRDTPCDLGAYEVQ